MTWLTRLVPGHAPDGGPVVSVLAKRTYRIRPGAVAALEPGSAPSWVEADEYWDTNNPALDAVKLESELVAWKPCTDVVVVGHAHAPRGKRARFFDCGIQVGAFRKMVRVFGNRKVQLKTMGFDFTEPEAFDSMPLHYGLAYGGRHRLADGQELQYPRNPVGKGFVVAPEPADLVNLVLPNLENPAQVLVPQDLALKSFEKWRDAPEPWALGYTSRNFHPRVTLAGLQPDQAIESEIVRLRTSADSEGSSPQPPVPVLNPDYFSGASKGLSLPHLRGDETIVLVYLDSDHPKFEFRLPGERPQIHLNVGQGLEWMEPVLQNVVIFKGTDQVELTWRGSCRYDGPESMSNWTTLKMGVAI
jgi:hypothetical protein